MITSLPVSLGYNNEVTHIQYPFAFQHHEEKIEKRQMVIDLHKCGNGYKKICIQLNIPLSTVRAIIKKFKRYGTVENLMGRGSAS